MVASRSGLFPVGAKAYPAERRNQSLLVGGCNGYRRYVTPPLPYSRMPVRKHSTLREDQ